MERNKKSPAVNERGFDAFGRSFDPEIHAEANARKRRNAENKRESIDCIVVVMWRSDNFTSMI
jgi:hypothetical protein